MLRPVRHSPPLIDARPSTGIKRLPSSATGIKRLPSSATGIKQLPSFVPGRKRPPSYATGNFTSAPLRGDGVESLVVPVTVYGDPCDLELRFKYPVSFAVSHRIATTLGTVVLDDYKDADIEEGECCHEGLQFDEFMTERGCAYRLSMQVDKNNTVTALMLAVVKQNGKEEILTTYGFDPAPGDESTGLSEGGPGEDGRAAQRVGSYVDTSEDENPVQPKRRRITPKQVAPQERNQGANAGAGRLVQRTLTRAAPGRIPRDIFLKNFLGQLTKVLTGDLATGDLNEQQKLGNTYCTAWLLPMQTRFFAAVLQAAYDACKQAGIDVTAKNASSVLDGAVAVLRSENSRKTTSRSLNALNVNSGRLGPSNLNLGKRAEINAALDKAHRMTNDSNPPLTLTKALASFPKNFGKMSEIDVILKSAAERIKEVDSERRVDVQELAAQLARLRIPRCTVAYMAANSTLAIDADNPFLPYLAESYGESTLLKWARAWEYITRNAVQEQELSPALLTNIWAILSTEHVPTVNGKHSLPKENGNDVLLMEVGEHAAQGTLTANGEAELKRKLAGIAEKHGVIISLGRDDDEKDSLEYGRKVITLERNNVPVRALSAMLSAIVEECNTRMADANGNEQDLTDAQLRLAMDLTQCRVFPDQNVVTGLMVVNLLRLRNGQSVPFMLWNPDILDGYSVADIQDVLHEQGAGSW